MNKQITKQSASGQKYYENTDDAIVMWCTDIQSDEYSQRIEAIVRSRP